MATAKSLRRHWKRAESKIMHRLGGERVPVTGRQRGDKPDGDHEWLSVEIKSRDKIPDWLHEAMDQAIQASNGRSKLPVAVVHENGCRHGEDLVVVKLRDWEEWFGAD